MSPNKRYAKNHAKARERRRHARERLAALRRRGLELPTPRIVGASWFGDSHLMPHVAPATAGHLVG
jgi:hypothetical protein